MDGRKHRRVGVKIPVYVSLQGELFQKSIRLESKDISGGGLSFETSQLLPVEANSRLVLGRVGDLPDAAQIEARVAYRRKDPTTGRYSVGVEFIRFLGTTQEELLARIAAWEAKQAAS